MTKIRTEISIESSESLIIRRKRYSVRAFCGACRRISILVLPTEAAFLSGRDVDSIITLMYENRLHVRRVGGGGLYVCLLSLCLQGLGEGPEETGTKTAERVLAGVRTGSRRFVTEE